VAERLLRRVQPEQPGDFWINFKLAGALFFWKKPSEPAEAAGFYRAALAVRPHSGAAYNNLGLALRAQGKLAEAESAFQRAIALQPDDADAHDNLDLALHNQGKLKEAEAAHRKAIELKPDGAGAHNNLGNTLLDQGQVARAMAAFRKAIRLKPDCAIAYNNLGNAYSHQGKFSEALAAHRKALELGDDQPTTHLNIAEDLRRLGKPAESGKAEAVVAGKAGIGGLSNQNLVAGNLIGTDATGLAALGNASGIGVGGNYNTIGGSTAAARNIISANHNPIGSAGIDIDDESGTGGRYNLVKGNYVGTDITGTTALGKQGGILVSIYASHNTIGGTTAAAGNVISGNGHGAIVIANNGTNPSSAPVGNAVLGNSIGTDPSGTRAVPNGGAGISISAANNNTIGGTAPGAGNTIAFNGQSGVFIDSGTGNSILGNSIYANGSPGIYLNSANNANDNQAAPVLTGLAGSAASPAISGTLTSVANTTFRIEFFASPAPGDPANTEGKALLGFTYVTTNASGSAAFNASGLSPIPTGEGYLTATATVATANGGSYTFGDRSAFSAYLHASYFFGGFLPPLGTGLSFALNRTIPVKFQLTDLSGNPVTSLGAVTSLEVAPVVNGVVSTPFAPASTNNQGLQSSGGQYLFTWQTRGVSAGTYEVVLTLADGTVHAKTIQLTVPGSGANAQAADGSDVSGGSTAGQLLGGDLEVYVSDPGVLFTADELARIQDAVNAVDAVVEPYGVSVEETTDPTQANVVIDAGGTSAAGGYSAGILGCYNLGGEITIIQGWNWYASADPAGIGAAQYDFQTTLTHQLGHALGLGESADPSSPMNGTLAPATVHRGLSAADLHIPYDESGADAQRAAFLPGVQAASPAAVASVEAGRPQPALGGGSGMDFTAPAAARAVPNGPAADALVVAQLTGAGQAGPVASLGIMQPFGAPFQTTPALAPAGGRVAPGGSGPVTAWAAPVRSLPDGDSPDTQGGWQITPPVAPSAGPANRGELSEAALAAFVQLGRQRDGNLALAGRGPVVVDEIFGEGQESGGLIRAGLVGAEPVLLALLASHWCAAERESRLSKASGGAVETHAAEELHLHGGRCWRA
jgi:Flp pilus assembly protein TadD